MIHARVRRHKLRHELEKTDAALLRSRRERPDDVEGREALWMQRDRLVKRLAS